MLGFILGPVLAVLSALPRWFVSGALLFIFGYSCGQVNASREYAHEKRQAEIQAKLAGRHPPRKPALASRGADAAQATALWSSPGNEPGR